MKNDIKDPASATPIVSETDLATKEYNVTSTVTIAATSTAVWNFVGDFCNIDDWHPDIIQCVLERRDDEVYRQLTLGDGVVVLEKLISTKLGISYNYRLVESPLPATDFTSSLSITGSNPTTLTWSGSFTSEYPEVEGAVQNLYDSGLAAINAYFSE